jgi:hypothetical protein
MVQFVGERVNGAGYGFGDAVGQREREAGFIACWKGDVLQSAEVVSYLLTLVSIAFFASRGGGTRTCSPESLHGRKDN